MDDHNGEIEEEDIENWHNENQREIIKEFNKTPQINIGDDESDASIDELFRQINESYEKLRLTTERRNEKLKKEKQGFLTYLKRFMQCCAFLKCLFSCFSCFSLCFDCPLD